MKTTRTVVTAAASVSLLTLVLAGCATGASAPTPDATADSGPKVAVVAAENEYADVVQQIGGDRVDVSAILSDPNTDPHTFEASASVAKEIAGAQLIVQNGLGYDDFMSDLEKASPDSSRSVIVAQDVLGLPDSTDNPHLWYDPKTMPAVATAVADKLSELDPASADAFHANLATFIASLSDWTDALSSFARNHPRTPVAVTEPVADYMLEAADADVKTPWNLQAAIMNDTDPSAQDTATQDALFTGKQVKVFLYNQQVTDDTTDKYLQLAKDNGIPVVGVYETMPANYHYQDWMLAEVKALETAVTQGTSTEHL